MERSRLFKNVLSLLVVLVLVLSMPVAFAEEEEPAILSVTFLGNPVVSGQGGNVDIYITVNDSAIGMDYELTGFQNSYYPPSASMAVHTEFRTIQNLDEVISIRFFPNEGGHSETYYFRARIGNGSWSTDYIAITQNAIPKHLVTVEAGVIQGKSSEEACPENGEVTIVANAAPYGQEFDKWITDNEDVVFADETKPTTTFTMPASDVTVTATYTDKYCNGTATDFSTGVRIAGYFLRGTYPTMQAEEVSLHDENTCNACDEIRARQANGQLVRIYHILLSDDSHGGDIWVQLPVGSQYIFKNATIYRCADGVLEKVSAMVDSNGNVEGAFGGANSLFAVAIEQEQPTAITGLPECYTFGVCEQVSWMPNPADGAWDYDSKYLRITQEGDSYTFKAIKDGKTNVTYTANGISHTVSITINKPLIPLIGNCFNIFNKCPAPVPVPVPSIVVTPVKIIQTISNIIQNCMENIRNDCNVAKPQVGLPNVGSISPVKPGPVVTLPIKSIWPW